MAHSVLKGAVSTDTFAMSKPWVLMVRKTGSMTPRRRSSCVIHRAGCTPAGGSMSCASTMETAGRAGTPGSIGLFSGCLRVTHAHAGRALPLPGSRGPRDRMLRLRPAFKAGKELAGIIAKTAVMGCPDPHIHAVRAAGDHREDVRFPIGDHRDMRRRVQNGGACWHGFQPAVAFLVAKRPVFGWLRAAAGAFDPWPVDRAEQRALFRLHRDRGRADKAVSRPVIPTARRVWNRPNRETIHAPGRGHGGLVNDLVHGHFLGPQKPAQADLTSAIAANTPNRNTTRTDLNQTIMKKAFGRIPTTITTMRTRVVHLYSPLVNTRPKIESTGQTANFRHPLRKQEKMCAYSRPGSRPARCHGHVATALGQKLSSPVSAARRLDVLSIGCCLAPRGSEYGSSPRPGAERLPWRQHRPLRELVAASGLRRRGCRSVTRASHDTSLKPGGGAHACDSLEKNEPERHKRVANSGGGHLFSSRLYFLDNEKGTMIMTGLISIWADGASPCVPMNASRGG